MHSALAVATNTASQQDKDEALSAAGADARATYSIAPFGDVCGAVRIILMRTADWLPDLGRRSIGATPPRHSASSSLQRVLCKKKPVLAFARLSPHSAFVYRVRDCCGCGRSDHEL